MEVQEIANIKVLEHNRVRVKEMGNVTEIMYSSNGYNSTCTIKKLCKDTYMDLTTGEIKQCNHIKNRGQNLSSVRKSLTKGRDRINTNVTDVTHCKFVTLTYQENMMDPKKLNKDFENFNVRLRKLVGHYEYIVAREPQGRGSWHCHVIMIFNSTAPFIPNDVIWKAWSPKGFKNGVDYTQTKKIDDVDNVGAYLTAYMADMGLDEAMNDPSTLQRILDGSATSKEIELNENGKKIKKQFVKGARLYLYPPGFHMFGYSKGIKLPDVSYDTEKNAQKKVSTAMLTHEKSIRLTDAEADFDKTINYRYYNSKRKE